MEYNATTKKLLLKSEGEIFTVLQRQNIVKGEKVKKGDKVKKEKKEIKEKRLLSGIEPRLLKIFISIITIIVLLNFIITIFLVIEITSLRTKTIEALKNADTVMEALTIKQILSEPGWIDPTLKGAQHMGFGFLVVGIKAKIDETDVLVSGRIINASSVDHLNARFTIVIGRGVDVDFTIDSLKSGFSAPFAVRIIADANETANETDDIEVGENVDVGEEGEVGEGAKVDITIPKGIRLIFRGSDVAYD